MALSDDVSSEHGGVRVRIDGKKLASALIGEQGLVYKELLKKVLNVERAAKELCPVDTGRLRSSITSAIETEGDTIVGVVGTDVEYASFVEYGTQRMDAQPFLMPAAYTVLSQGS